MIYRTNVSGVGANIHQARVTCPGDSESRVTRMSGPGSRECVIMVTRAIKTLT